MDSPAIIPTRYRKSKVPKTHTYPLGAKMISEALAGVPQFDGLTVRFYYYKPMARFNKPSTRYQVLQVSYSGPGTSPWKRITENNLPKRKVRVDAVPCLLRHTIQSELIATALPAVRHWLMTNPHSNDREGSHALIFEYDELAEELRSEERSSIEWRTSRV
jgi:hypothetical protein